MTWKPPLAPERPCLKCGALFQPSIYQVARNTGRYCSRPCAIASVTKHGACTRLNGQTVEYCTWQRIIARCSYPKYRDYSNWGGRGIGVCERWRKSFVAFLEDMGPRPSSRHSIDRKDNSRGYEPDNCRWATPKEQANNKRSSRVLTIHGEARTVAQWAEYAGLDRHTLMQRLKRLPPEEAISRPLRGRVS